MLNQDGKQRIIIFGGTFDPVHNGHLAIAAKAATLFKSGVTFLPAQLPNYKNRHVTSASHRLNMLKLALASDQRFIIDEQELRYKSYTPTYFTLANLRKKYGKQVPIFFLLGSDSLTNLATWERWQELFNLVNFIIVPRLSDGAGCLQIVPNIVQVELKQRLVSDLAQLNLPAGLIYYLPMQPIAISSTAIRSAIVKQIQVSEFGIMPLVPKSVADYIIQHDLYLNE